MEPSQFDDLTKALATSTTRRHALKTIVTTALGGLLGLGGLGTVFAKTCKPPCSPGLACCGGTCVDTKTDPNNCGVCGTKCRSGLCVNGLCCPPGAVKCGNSCCSFTCCGTTCVDTRNDVNNCGSCGNVCSGSTPVCHNGKCVACANPATDFCNLNSTCGGPGNNCACVQSVEGGVYCSGCGECAVCTSDSDCVQQFGSLFPICMSAASGCCSGISTSACVSATCPCTCFTAGTLIAMADGTSRPIEHVQVGDRVLSNRGRLNRVAEIDRTVLGSRHLYALNGSGFFVTAEHPFMTEEGWKSIDPAALAAEHSALRVGCLTVGDRLLTLADVAVPAGGRGAISAEAVDVRINSVALHSLIGQPADPATPLYNLRLDGDHTYFANDLLVHNK